MTDKELQIKLKEMIERGDCFNSQVQQILVDFKNAGGQQETAKNILNQLTIGFSHDTILQDRTYDILDMVTGWCSSEMSVWDY